MNPLWSLSSHFWVVFFFFSPQILRRSRQFCAWMAECVLLYSQNSWRSPSPSPSGMAVCGSLPHWVPLLLPFGRDPPREIKTWVASRGSLLARSLPFLNRVSSWLSVQLASSFLKSVYESCWVRAKDDTLDRLSQCPVIIRKFLNEYLLTWPLTCESLLGKSFESLKSFHPPPSEEVFFFFFLPTEEIWFPVQCDMFLVTHVSASSFRSKSECYVDAFESYLDCRG